MMSRYVRPSHVIAHNVWLGWITVMADQKYSNKYQKHWGVPKINLVAGHGRSPLYDVRASYGDKKTTGAQTPLQHASPTVLSNGRMQPSTPAGGIVTRSKLNAQGTSRECVSPSPSREDPRNGDRVDQDERVKAEIQQESLEKMTSPVVNQRGTPVCSEAGKCQGGGELRLSSLAEMSSNIDVPSSYALVGCKSPLLPGIMLVAAVDKRYLPDEETSTTMLGFSGNCIGCGAKGFRYFTEYSQHINLRLATQPKKQKHMKYYIIKDSSGRLRKGNIIPWRVEGRKRSMPLSGSFVVLPDEDTPNDQSSVSMVSGPPVLSQYPQATPNSNNGDTLTVTSYQPPLVAASYSGPPSAKRHRWESGSDSETVYVDFEIKCFKAIELFTMACLHGVHDIIVSDLLVGCFDPPQVSDLNQFGNFTGAYNTTGESFSHPSRGPSGQSRYYQSTLSPLTTQMAILLMIQYLSQFDEDDRVMREEVESLLQDAQLELSAGYQNAHILAQSNLLTHVQLPILANLAAVPSKGRVKIVTSPVTLENAIVRGLKFIMDIIKHNQSKFPKVPMPDYIFLLSTSQKKAPEFCVLISGVNQARYLTEAMIGHPVGARITDNVAKLEQLFRLSSDALEQLVSSYEEAMCHDGKLVYVPFNGFARMKVLEEEALKLEPKVTITSFQHYGQKNSIVYSTQNQIAKQLVSQVCSIAENSSSLDVNRFVKVDLVIIVPPITTLFNQTVQRLADSNVLADLELEDDKSAMSFEAGLNYVIKHDDDDDSQEKLSSFLKNVQLQPTTLFILIFDQAQFYSKPRGVLDLPFYKEFLEASNVIPLFVTSAPYLFQTNYSFIDPENEVYWTDSRTDSDSSSVTSTPIEDDQYIDDQDSMYFGLKEYCDSIKWTHQFPLFRQDDAFERMALRTTRATEDVNVSVLRCYLLIRHYCAAIMWSAGIKPAEPHCTLKTIQIIREIIESPLRNADGSGSMLAIRIPSVELAMMAYESLKVIRDRLGFQYRFAVIHDNGMGELEIEEYFLKRLRFCKAQRDVVEEDGMSAVETMTETPRQSSVAGSETEDNGADDSKPNSPYQKNNTDERETKTVRIAQDTKPNNPRPIPTPKSNASESDTEAGAMVTTDDESDNEAGGVNKYHPRSILFSGLPQTSTSDSKETASKSPQSERPEFKVISQIPFNSELKGYQFAKASPLLLYSSKKEPHPSTTKKDNTSQIKDSPIDTRPVTSVLLSSWAAHDICHHCDSCKVYRDGIGPSTSLYHTYQLESGEHLHFLIPPTHVSEFTFTDDKQLRSLRLTKVLHVLKGVNGEVVTIKNEGELSNKPAIKSPIMIPSTGRHESDSINHWDTEFATQNFFKERLRQGVDGSGSEDIWPMMLMMDDSCVLWQNLLQHSSSPPEEDSKDKEGTSIPFNANSSLLKVMKAVESIPDITKYGAIGFSHFSSKTTHMTRPSFSHTLLNTAVVLNLPALKKLQYSRNKYSCEDLDFSLLMHSHGTPTFRFDHLTVAKKSIESGGQMAIKLFINSSESSIGTGGNSRVSSVNVNDYSNFVTAPDTDDTHYFSAPAQYLLERYLAEGAALKLFKTAADKPDHPIVIIDNYVNLGPRLTVEYVSTVSMKERKLRTKGSEKNKSSYGGLLLYFSGQAVTKELLQQFQFVDDAQLCLVCQDRNTLRQEVVRLDLEENWRFRLRDELQTANDPDDPSLFLLTGTHE
ncbi:hypothetical protein QZH41_007131 [Actinostola sp. cb2023]|nr:hypothetical protein QZH41_007131 [Actinostola sp. cb2023]